VLIGKDSDERGYSHKTFSTISRLCNVAKWLEELHFQTAPLSSGPTTKMNEFSFCRASTPGTGKPFRRRVRSGSGCPPPLAQVSLTDWPARANACPFVDLGALPATLTSRLGALAGAVSECGWKKRENREKKVRYYKR
jgi:hypothetical protein